MPCIRPCYNKRCHSKPYSLYITTRKHHIGLPDGPTDGQMNRQTDEQTDRQTDEQTDGPTDGWADVRTHAPIESGFVASMVKQSRFCSS